MNIDDEDIINTEILLRPERRDGQPVTWTLGNLANRIRPPVQTYIGSGLGGKENQRPR